MGIVAISQTGVRFPVVLSLENKFEKLHCTSKTAVGWTMIASISPLTPAFCISGASSAWRSSVWKVLMLGSFGVGLRVENVSISYGASDAVVYRVACFFCWDTFWGFRRKGKSRAVFSICVAFFIDLGFQKW